ncbi:MAG: [FeFe] hydrogenase H-cluster radical SAM maturase HydE [Bacteroidota bacterium]
MNLHELLHKEDLTRSEIIFLLNLKNNDDLKLLYARADQVRSKYCGDEVHLRGIIDISNFCEQNCVYCGLRQDNHSLPRFRMTPEEVIETARVITNLGIFTIVIQSGEDAHFDSDIISYIIYQIRQKSNAAITLSLGERTFDEYRAWKIAGADRYLLKHETANPKLYETYHFKQQLSERIEHLKFLKSIGYQIGSGNLIGLPLQTVEDLADDILLCKSLDLDMAAFGPFIPSPQTPYHSKNIGEAELTLKVTAVARIVLKKVHIPATTALDTIDPLGREKGLTAGANVVMPDLTPFPYREQYKIYPGKRGSTDDPLVSTDRLKKRIEALGRKISYKRGDSLKMDV